MNKLVIILLVACATVSALYPRVHYHGGHKTHLGGAAYAYRPVKYVYRKPIVYAHKSYAKPRTVHYVRPAYHHEVPHYGHAKPAYYLGGHVGHHLAYLHKGH